MIGSHGLREKIRHFGYMDHLESLGYQILRHEKTEVNDVIINMTQKVRQVNKEPQSRTSRIIRWIKSRLRKWIISSLRKTQIQVTHSSSKGESKPSG